MEATYLVTGANRGIGLELARQLGDRGNRVIATCRVPYDATQLLTLPVEVLPLVISSGVSIAALAHHLADRPVDVLINNAGVGDPGPPLGQLHYDGIRDYFLVNAAGTLRVTESLLEQIRLGVDRKIVNVTSQMGSLERNTSGGYYAYRGSKAALNMFTRNLAIDLHDEGIICIVIHAGWVQTEMGGRHAPLTTSSSVNGMLNVIDNLQPGDSGKLLSHEGGEIPW